MSAKVFAAGSLRTVLTEVGAAFRGSGGGDVAFEFGPSGVLCERLARGEAADVFASANMEHPQSLTTAGRAGPVRRFARNRLCALVRADAGVTAENLLERMLEPQAKLATSTPKVGPAGDYAWQLFERAEKLRAGSFDVLSNKALQLLGGTVHSTLVANGEADILFTYCTNALQAVRAEPSLAMVELPEALAVGGDYGVITMHGASPAGVAFAKFLLDAEGQWILSTAGFVPIPGGSGR